MNRPLRRAPLNLYSPLYVRALTTTTLLVVLLTPVNPQMTRTNHSKNPAVDELKINKTAENDTLIQEFDVPSDNATTNDLRTTDDGLNDLFDVEKFNNESFFTENATVDYPINSVYPSSTETIEKSTENKLAIKNVTTKQYQTLLDRFRRKNVTESRDEKINIVDDHLVTNKTISNNSLEDVVINVPTEKNKAITEEQLTDFKFENSTMEKLIDEATRNKIFYDYFKTIKREGTQTESLDDTEIEADINFNETLGAENVVRQKEIPWPLNFTDRTTDQVPPPQSGVSSKYILLILFLY
ncbi:hypothetical protein O0L34_g11629 [Tuta absoluta]|nr:hypothetical protein O0L34_g11629 [Tuta absoluta]